MLHRKIGNKSVSRVLDFQQPGGVVVRDFKDLMVVTRAARIDISTRVLLELDNGRGYIGMTDNVSESGVYFTLGYCPVTVNIGDIGFLHVMPLNGHRPLPCQVARLTEDGIAVQLIDRAPTERRSSLTSVRHGFGGDHGQLRSGLPGRGSARVPAEEGTVA
ncbi:MAG: PilZ domain-containing protein [Magnetococcales bacterium]|nr:PilZ domain-containing protein [Magnetococcales bacterium]